MDQARVGPHPSHVHTRRQFFTQQEIEILSSHPKLNSAKEDTLRLQIVNLIDNMRQHLRLPTRTFATGVMYYHTFRLTRPDLEYSPYDAASAALFVACKIEDTLKRSKEVIAAAKNYRLNSTEQIPWDSGHFDAGAKNAIGMERLVLETIGFDFRSRVPQELIVKLCKYWNLPKDTVYQTAFEASLDLYRTYAPMKMTSGIMALACIELAAKIHNVVIPSPTEDEAVARNEEAREYAVPVVNFADRARVMETVQDILDLYEHAQAPFTTKLGAKYSRDEFVRVKLEFKQIMESENLARYAGSEGKAKEDVPQNGTNDSMDIDTPKSKTASTTTSPKETNGTSKEESLRAQTAMKEGTLRYMVDIDRAKQEKEAVYEYFNDKTEEYEVEEEIVNQEKPKPKRRR